MHRSNAAEFEGIAMYLVAVMDKGAERIFRTDTVALTLTSLTIAVEGTFQMFAPSQLVEIVIIQDHGNGHWASRRVLVRPESELLN